MRKIFKRIVTGFVALTTAATMFIGNGVSANCLQGDVNSDGTINLYDAICISSCLAKNDITTIKNSGDYNKDGAVNIYDAVEIAKSVASKMVVNKELEYIKSNYRVDWILKQEYNDRIKLNLNYVGVAGLNAVILEPYYYSPVFETNGYFINYEYYMICLRILINEEIIEVNCFYNFEVDYGTLRLYKVTSNGDLQDLVFILPGYILEYYEA